VSLDRRVQQALDEAGDTTSALLWRRVCHDLEGAVTIGLLAADDASLRSLRRGVQAMGRDDIHLVDIPVDDDASAPSLGAEDRLLACHVLAAATPYPRALGSEERTRLAAITSVAPRHRRVVLVGRDLLERLSDRPDEEAAEVLERAEAIAPDGWTVCPEDSLAAWLEPLLADRGALARERRHQVARLLLSGAAESLGSDRERLAAERVELTSLLDAEDDALDDARREARRTAAHVLAAVRRHTDALLVELRAFLTELERDVPDQAEAIESLALLRRTLPHWLHHVVEDWLVGRLARWRIELARDLEEVGVDRAVAARAELVVPAMAPGPVHADGSWTSRLGATAAMGGGAALLLAGLWFPALVALTGGLAWSTLGRSARDAESRRNVVDAAIEALRAMASDAERLLSDQLDHVEKQLADLEEEAARDHADARHAIRSRLQGRGAALDDAIATLDARAGSLQAMLQELEDPS
jgi:hypothetical protein